MNNDILNEAVRLSLEWGKDWQASIVARIVEIHPHLTEAQADELDALCREVQSFCFALYEDVYFEKTTRAKAEFEIKTKYTFLDNENVTRLYNQGMYYAWRG